MDFLFENPILILIVIGMITSFFKRLKGQEPTKANKGPNWKKMIDIPDSYQEDRPEVVTEPVSTHRQKTVVEKYNELKVASRGTHQNDEKLTKPIYDRRESNFRKLNVKSELVEDEVGFELSPTSEKVIEGIVWAEILGPPKAMKPHQPKRTAFKR